MVKGDRPAVMARDPGRLYHTGLLWSLVLGACAARNVLLVQMVGTGSHEFVMRRLGEQLVQRGHRVTQIRWLHAFSDLVPANSSVEIISRRVKNAALRHRRFDAAGVFQPVSSGAWRGASSLGVALDLAQQPHTYCEDLLGDQRLLRRMRRRRFDVAIVDVYCNVCGVAFARALRLPVVGLYVVSVVGSEQSNLMGLVNMPSAVVAQFTGLTPPMSLLQRLHNAFVILGFKLVSRYLLAVSDIYVQKYHPELPTSASLMRNLDMALYNSNFLVTQPLLLPPNMQAIGCVQCTPPRPLPQNLETFFKSSGEHGVIIFCMGITLYDPELIPVRFIERFMRIFSRLEQKVLAT
ncbi:UDP-glucuronosyltransferase 1A9-like [Pollicipes pollicipes]|uniref:UDP-glucuronosyltransferase 1A9-like n=1 Tax=Pollicipes pollicipes TaxID=41117 RepID=UPI0018859D9E|nr:UDP-glucuronosyltransferase 1A9-like [Pollicipes pollicipes]